MTLGNGLKGEPIEPQWSPPVVGGMTQRGRGVGSTAKAWPQMEPARRGRDDHDPHFGADRRGRAAMEPARRGRDDLADGDASAAPVLSRNGARPSWAG